MRVGKGISVALLVLGCVFSDGATSANSGFYFSAGIGRAREKPTSGGTNLVIGTPPVVIAHLDPSEIDAGSGAFAWSVGTGYRFNSHLAAELSYLDFGSRRVTEHYNDGPVADPFPPINFDITISSKVTGPALSLLGSAPVGKKFEVFLRAGLLFADRRVKLPPQSGRTETFGAKVWLGGLGANFSITDKWRIRAEYQRSGKFRQSLLLDRGTEVEQLSLSLLFNR